MDKPMSRVKFINIMIFVQASLLLIATIWSQSIPLSLANNFSFELKSIGLGALGGIIISGTAFVLLWLGKNVPALGQLREMVMNQLVPLLAELKWPDLIMLALVSGFCEEIFFRGVLQPQFGLIVASLIFGFFHDPTFRFVSYSLFAFMAGLLLGWLYMATGNLYVPITAHILHNLISLFVLRYMMRPPGAAVGQS